MFAAGIIFTVFVQRNANMSKTITLYFEEAKSGLATGVWLWLLLDTIFGPEHHYWYYYNGPRGPRITRAAISVILLLYVSSRQTRRTGYAAVGKVCANDSSSILYYPTLIYSLVEKRYEDRGPPEDREATAGQEQGERQPLLS